MKLYVPACGDRLTLSAPWSFRLFLEHRNIEFAKRRELVPPDAHRYSGYVSGGGLRHVDAVLGAGTVLECDRVYIRTFNKSHVAAEDDFDSITWKAIGSNGKPLPRQRFWVKLSECNGLEYEDVSSYRDRVKLARLVMET